MQQSLISEQDKTQLRRTFRKDLKRQVQLRLFTQRQSLLTIPGRECPYCPQTEQLMEELAGLTPKVELETVDFYGQPDVAKEQGVTRIPAIVLSADGSARVKFYGAPMGYEMATIVEDIKTISRGVSPLSMDTRKKLRQLNQDVHIQVFVTPICTFCPGMARLAHAVALESPRVTSDVIEIQEFPALGQTYGVRSVPLTVINEHIRFTGAVTETQFMEKVMEAGVRNSG
jgi:glutaredoxin-like protein